MNASQRRFDLRLVQKMMSAPAAVNQGMREAAAPAKGRRRGTDLVSALRLLSDSS